MMESIKAYFRESYHELKHNVTWPTWQSLQSHAVLVLVSTLFLSLLIAGADWISSTLLGIIY